MVAERFKVLEALFPGRIDLGLGRAPGTDPVTSLRAAAPPGRSATTTISSSASRSCCCSRARLPGGPSVPQGARHAGGRAAAADLAARLERLQRAARRACRRGIFLRASFLRSRSGRPDAGLPRAVQAVGDAATSRYAILGVRGGRAPTATPKPSGSPRTIDLNCVRRAAAANTCRSRAPRRPRPIPIRRSTASCIAQQPRAADRRPPVDGAGAACAADRSDPGRRGDDHHHDLRPCGAPALLRSCWPRRSG